MIDTLGRKKEKEKGTRFFIPFALTEAFTRALVTNSLTDQFSPSVLLFLLSSMFKKVIQSQPITSTNKIKEISTNNINQ